VIRAYLAAYGPATTDNLRNWLARGRVSIRRLRAWVAALGDRLTEVEVDGEPAWIRTEDIDELAAARPSTAVRLLPGFDAYVLGPGTDDPQVIAPARRAAVSRPAGWISPVVVAGGVVAGTWELNRDTARITWFREAGKAPRLGLEAEVSRLGAILDQGLHGEITVA
jgi:hypothetical protein